MSRRLSEFMSEFRQDRAGSTAMEYGLIALLVSIAIIGGVGALALALGRNFDGVAAMVAGIAG